MGILGNFFKEDDQNEATVENVELKEGRENKILVLPVDDFNSKTEDIANAIKEYGIVIVKFSKEVDFKVQQRVIDFIYGSTSMVNARIYKIDDLIFMVVAKNIQVNNLDK